MSHYIGGISHYPPAIPPRYPYSREIQAARSNFAGENFGASFSRRIRVCSIKMHSLVFGPRIDIAAWPEGTASVKRLTPPLMRMVRPRGLRAVRSRRSRQRAEWGDPTGIPYP